MSRKIIKVTLKDGGFKGAVVRYERKSLNKETGLYFPDKYNVHYGTPVNKEFIEAMDAFKPHLIELCNLDPNIAYEDIKIMAVEAHDDWFKIWARVRSVGVSESPMNTAKIEDDGSYDGQKQAADKVLALYREVRSYIKEKKVMDPMQMVMNFAAQDKKFEEKFPGGVESMSEEEQKDYYRKGCEKHNMIVIEQEAPEVADEADGDAVGEGTAGDVEGEIMSDEPSAEYEQEVDNPDQHEAAQAPVRETPGKVRTLQPEVKPDVDEKSVKTKRFGS